MFLSLTTQIQETEESGLLFKKKHAKDKSFISHDIRLIYQPLSHQIVKLF